ncbi:uncharacterized protein LOC108213583 [Daucus carota subsp. sativus]|uniref:uncharacterized protein LOC108213583 n=1 Tax=Daucus carota subsp. sativus TaxID=79200 RepID=UPI0007EF746E|nr:PREDICTED: uncharacterized protein LOC108213583 isoform X4 [Daucus carota subsp. sativus]
MAMLLLYGLCVMGDLSVKFSEENRIAAQEAKGKAVEAISEGEVNSSLLGEREDMTFRYKRVDLPDMLERNEANTQGKTDSG